MPIGLFVNLSGSILGSIKNSPIKFINKGIITSSEAITLEYKITFISTDLFRDLYMHDAVNVVYDLV